MLRRLPTRAMPLFLGLVLLATLLSTSPRAEALDLGAHVSVENADAVTVNDDPTADLTFHLTAPAPGNYEITWWIENAAGVHQVPGGNLPSDSFSDTTSRTFEVDMTGLQVGAWSLRVSMNGGLTPVVTPQAEGAFTVTDAQVHVTVTPLNGSTFYPYRDYYRDVAEIPVSYPNDHGYLEIIAEFFDADGASVGKRIHNFGAPIEWDGRDSKREILPEGLYTIRITAENDQHTSSTYDGGTVRLSHDRLVTRVWRKTVSARASMVNNFVGACSSLRQPSARGIRGSLGMYSNTKCRKSVRKSEVLTVHSVRVPKVLLPYGVRLTAIGGAAKTAPGSYGGWAYYQTNGKWRFPCGGCAQLTSAFGSHFDHEERWYRASRAVQPDRRFIWEAYMANGARYDLVNFTVRFRYRTLVAP